MNRKETTQFLSDLLISSKFSGMGKYWAREVTLDYLHGKGKEKRVDFMQFVPDNQYSISGLEKGLFISYEIKSCKADVFSGHGLNFETEKNYLVMTMDTYKEILSSLDKLPHGIGILIACPKYRELADEFEEPTDITENIWWTLKAVKVARTKHRNRSMNELLFCMLRSGR